MIPTNASLTRFRFPPIVLLRKGARPSFRNLPVLVFLVLAGTCPASAGVPHRIAHQGRIAVEGINYDGPGDFKFLLFTDADTDHGNGTEVAVWKNDDESPTDMTEPATAVTLAVNRGLYHVFLGDTGQAALPANLQPAEDDRLFLRIWFDDGIHGNQLLTPDQEIASVPFALHANTASGIAGNLDLGDADLFANSISIGPEGEAVMLSRAPADPERVVFSGVFSLEGEGASTVAGDLEIANGLSVTRILSNLIPDKNDVHSIGHDTRRWKELYLAPTGLHLGAPGDDATIAYDTVADAITMSDAFTVMKNGDVSAGGSMTTGGNFRYVAPRTRKLAISAGAFQPGWLEAMQNDNIQNFGIYLYVGTASVDFAIFSAPVQLPPGSTITKFTAHFYDNEPGTTNGDFQNCNLTLRRISPDAPTATAAFQNVAVINFGSTGASEQIQSDTRTISHAVVEGDYYSMILRLDNCAGVNMRFYGATIEYTTDTVQP